MVRAEKIDNLTILQDPALKFGAKLLVVGLANRVDEVISPSAMICDSFEEGGEIPVMGLQQVAAPRQLQFMGSEEKLVLSSQEQQRLIKATTFFKMWQQDWAEKNPEEISSLDATIVSKETFQILLNLLELLEAHPDEDYIVSEDQQKQCLLAGNYLNVDETVLSHLLTEKQKIMKEFPFGPEMWNRYYGDIGEVPPLPEEMYTFLRSNPNPPVMLTLIPATINGALLTLNSFEQLVSHPREGSGGHSIGYEDVWDSITTDHGDAPIVRSFWLLTTKAALPGSSDETYDTQSGLSKAWAESTKALLPETAAEAADRTSAEPKADYYVPETLAMSVAILTHYVKTGEILFRRELGAGRYTYCQEMTEGIHNTVGSLALSGLNVKYHSYGLGVNGAAGSRKFLAP